MSAPRFRVLQSSYEQAEREKRYRNDDNVIRGRQLNKVALIAAFTLPGMIVFALFVLIPIFQSFYYSLYNWDGFGAPSVLAECECQLFGQPVYVFGEPLPFGNYEELLNHRIFQMSLGNSLTITALSLTIQLPLALGLALLVGRGNLRGRRFFRVMLFIPYVFSEVITALIWRYVLSPDPDALWNAVLRMIIPSYETVGWLGDRSIVLYSLFAVLTWKYFGFYMILYMAGLQNVPPDLEEAARVDGAREGQVLRYVTLPMLGSTIRLTIFISIIGSFQQFVLTWVFTNEGGPAYASSLLATYVYEFGIQRLRLGYGSAVAVVLFAITFIFSLGYQRMIMRQDLATGRR